MDGSGIYVSGVIEVDGRIWYIQLQSMSGAVDYH
jgi:hypothetical protein